MIQTVLGEIRPEELGVTLCHEHLAVNLSTVRNDPDSVFTDSPLIRDEVLKAKSLGVQSFIEVSCNDMGRDVRALQQLSKATGVHIVCATGFYLDVYHPDWVRNGTIEEIQAQFVHDLTEGIDDTGIKAGVIGEVAGEADRLTESETKVLSAAARAGAHCGCAVTTHCQMGKMGLEQSALLQKNGQNPEKIVLGHLDLANDMEYYREVLKTGVNIAFDTCGKIAYLADEIRADNLCRLLDEGWGGHIMLSNDISRKSYLTANGKFGYTAVLGRVVPMLKNRGVTEADLNKLLVANPARIFNIEK